MENVFSEEEIKRLKREYEKQWRAKNKRYWQKKLATIATKTLDKNDEQNDNK